MLRSRITAKSLVRHLCQRDNSSTRNPAAVGETVPLRKTRASLSQTMGSLLHCARPLSGVRELSITRGWQFGDNFIQRPHGQIWMTTNACACGIFVGDSSRGELGDSVAILNIAGAIDRHADAARAIMSRFAGWERMARRAISPTPN